jgi:CHAD domain-containing protein
MPTGVPIKEYGRQQVSNALDALIFELHQTHRLQDAESVHRLRVSIMRFRQALRVFEQFFPNKKSRRLRRQLRSIRYLAGDVRSRDVAMELLAKAGAPLDALQKERSEYKQSLIRELEEVCTLDLAKNWRTELGIGESA